MIDEANMSLEESGTPSHEIMVIVLHREFTSGSIGITLAGGADYECKDITVSEHRYHVGYVLLLFPEASSPNLNLFPLKLEFVSRFTRSYLEHWPTATAAYRRETASSPSTAGQPKGLIIERRSAFSRYE